MRNRVFTTGLVVLVGSLVLNVTVTLEPQQNATVKEKHSSKDSVQNKVITYLTSKGIEHTSIQKLLHNKHNIDERSVTALSNILGVDSDVVIKEISNKILHKKHIDLNSVDTLISLAQSIKGGLVSSESIDKIHEMAKTQTSSPFTIC
jgi:hypothetical protein